MIERFDRFLGQRVSMRSLGIVRVLVGMVALMHLWPFVTDALRGGTYQDHFHHAFSAWYPDLPEPLYAGLLVIGCIAAVGMSLGLWSRVTTSATFGVVAYNLFLSTTHMHNNRAYLVIVLALLAAAPCGRALSADSWLRRRRGQGTGDQTSAAWPLWLLRFECAAVYGASGFSKLIDPDWFGGTVTWGRMVAEEAMVRSSALPAFVADLLLDRSFHTLAAKLIVGTELFIAGGLWWRRTRRFAIAAAVVFHVSIQFTAEVQVFSYLALAVLFVWADPAVPWLRLPTRRSQAIQEEPSTAAKARA
ncbi:MAG TPA: HTTM domain-containing protein [Dehalococcoidia bacterium]|nr:HTTM domain-containing protein [Dehalococcoidia bacterium]